MRVAHVVTAVTPDGAYGGPLQVALNQIRSLRERGIDAVLVGGARGFEGDLPTVYEGVPCQLFPAISLAGRRYAGWVAPKLLRWMLGNTTAFDLFHIHLARDFITTPTARIALAKKAAVLVQTHGMVTPTSRRLLGMFDSALTRRVLREAYSVAALTESERDQLLSVANINRRIELVVNGLNSPLIKIQSRRSERKKEVLFVGRIHSVKRPVQFVEMASILLKKFPDYTFTLVGPDEGEGDAVRQAITSTRSSQVRWIGPKSSTETKKYMSEAQVLVCTSERESFGLALIEGAQAGAAIVFPDNLALAPVIRDYRAGQEYDGSLFNLVETMGRLLSTESLLEELGHNGQAMVDDLFTMEAVTNQLAMLYTAAADGMARE